jgi:hypothetical protein
MSRVEKEKPHRNYTYLNSFTASDTMAENSLIATSQLSCMIKFLLSYGHRNSLLYRHDQHKISATHIFP